MRVTRSRELVAEGYRPSVVARVAQISRQAISRVAQTGRTPASPSRPPADEVEAAIVAEAEANPTDGYRLVTAWVRRRLGRPVNQQARAARDALTGWQLQTRCRAREAIALIEGAALEPGIAPGTPDA